MRFLLLLFQTPEDKLIITCYEKLELAPPHPDAEQEEDPRSQQPGVGVHGAVVTPPCLSCTRFTMHSTHSDLSAQSSHSFIFIGVDVLNMLDSIFW